MIHDATVEVTCDNDAKMCWETVNIPIPAGTRNTYIAQDVLIERKLVEEGWIVKDGKHFCSEECAKANGHPSTSPSINSGHGSGHSGGK